MRPNFLVVGAAKAGTTAIHMYLRQHPEVFVPEKIKESFFLTGLSSESFPGPGASYATGAIRDLDAYDRLFETAHHRAVGEVCVAYLYFHQQTIPHILDVLGATTRILMCLRDPVERAHSNYLHHVRDGLETLSFEDALAAEDARRRKGWWWGFRYRDVGFYHEQVRAYLEAFGRERVTVLLYDDLRRDPARFMQDLFAVLEVDPGIRPDVSLRPNESGVPRSRVVRALAVHRHGVGGALRPLLPRILRRRASAWLQHRLRTDLLKPTMKPETHAALVETFRPDVEQLADLIGRDLSISWWGQRFSSPIDPSS